MGAVNVLAKAVDLCHNFGVPTREENIPLYVYFYRKETTMKKVLKIICLILAIVVVGYAVLFVVNTSKNKKPAITNELVVQKLEAVSELTAARLTYKGLLTFEEGEIPLLTKKAFFMEYLAEIEAIVDLSAANIDCTDTFLRITLPKIKASKVVIDPQSIKFTDSKFALINWSGKEDALDAMKHAQADVEENANLDQLIATAEAQTTLLLQNLFADLLGERTLEIIYK